MIGKSGLKPPHFHSLGRYGQAKKKIEEVLNLLQKQKNMKRNLANAHYDNTDIICKLTN